MGGGNIPEAVAVHQGLIPKQGFGFFVNTVTVRGKANVAFIPFGLIFAGVAFSKWKAGRREVNGRKQIYNDRMAKINEECKDWLANGKTMPAKLLVKNERPITDASNPIYV